MTPVICIEREPGKNEVMPEITSRYIVMPQHANPNGLMFGGVLMAWMDMAAAMVAEKHSGMNVATVRVDQVDFCSPIRIGDHVAVTAVLCSTGRTSMKIKVIVDTEDVKSGTLNRTTSATLTFVALSRDNRPVPVPKI